MAVATVDQVVVALGRPFASSAEEEQAEWWLDGVELFLAAKLGDLTLLDQSALAFVEAEAIAAKLRRSGTQESSITVAVDDGSVTRRYDNTVNADDVLDEWWTLLGYRAPSRARTMRVSGLRDR